MNRPIRPACYRARRRSAAPAIDQRRVPLLSCRRPDGSTPKYSLHLGRTDGTGPTRVIAPICEEAAAWSPDGKRVAYAVVLDLELGYRHPARITRIFFACIDGSCEQMILERPGLWHPQDWSPDGKFVAVTAIRKTAKPEEWKSLNFELGVIDRMTVTYKKVAWYEKGLRGPICWSPDGSEILFSRPLKNGDKREGFKGDSGALRQENGLGLWSIKPDGTRDKFLTTGWSPDWR